MRPIAIFAAAMLLVGCSAPFAAPDSPSFQSKVESVNDWGDLAGRTAARVTDRMNAPAYYIAPGPSDMPFAVAFKKLLEKRLLAKGYHILRSPRPDAVVLNINVEPYLYGSDHRYKRIAEYATFWTTLADLGYAFRHGSTLGTAAGVAAVAGPVMDILFALDDRTTAEVLMTATVVNKNEVLYADTEVFYIQPSDLPLYWTQFPDTAPMMTANAAVELDNVRIPLRKRAP